MNEESVLEVVEDLDDATLISMWNDYCEGDNMFDSHVYSQDELNEVLDGDTPDEIARKICYGEFNPNDEYFSFDGNANLKSSNVINELICISDLVNYIIRNEETFGLDELEELLEEDDDDTEED